MARSVARRSAHSTKAESDGAARPTAANTAGPWPRAMTLERAARYVGMGPSTLLREVKEGRAPPPVKLTPGGCVRWLKEQLDAWVDDCAARAEDGKALNPWDGPAR